MREFVNGRVTSDKNISLALCCRASAVAMPCKAQRPAMQHSRAIVALTGLG
jgi:hypothetical protein